MLALAMPEQPQTFSYPKTKKIDHSDNYHGKDIQDPYRWLELPHTNEEVAAWIEEQNKLSFSFLATIPERKAIRERLNELWNYPKQTAPFKKGNKYFETRNSGLQNQNVLFVMDRLGKEGKVLLDPNTLSEDGTAALRLISVSPDGKYLAYAVSQSGSDWQHWKIRNTETLEDLDETLEWSKFGSATWLPDSSGFYYPRYAVQAEAEVLLKENTQQTLYLHLLDTSQEADTLLYENPSEPKWMPSVAFSSDDAYLILTIRQNTLPINLVYVKKAGSSEAFKPIIDSFEASYSFVGNKANEFYFLTTHEASRGKLIALNIDKPSKKNWQVLIAESEDTLQDCRFVKGEFIALYLHHASHVLKRFTLSGEFKQEVTLPTLGSILELNTKTQDTEVFYSFTSFLYPTLSFKLELNTGTTTQLSSSSVDFRAEDFVTTQVFATSKDGTKVPLFLVHKKDLKLDKQNPTLLYGYGGFNISLSPSFSISRLAWLELGGVLAVANLRGGGEYGGDWHKAGTVHNKQNVFDDFIACAEKLIADGFTSPKKLAIQGGSNGGLLVGAAMTQRPELFAAALPAVGVMDMLRFHKFTIGWAWVGDFGSSEDPEQFETILKYSPLHNLRAADYPATLVTTGDHDDRVVPAHSFKFAATLQEANTGQNPMLIRIQTKAGHGAGKPTSMLIEEQADLWGFLVKILDIKGAL